VRGREPAAVRRDEQPPAEGGPLYAGFDVGRKRDLSVLWVLEKVGDVFWTRVCARSTA
jgi:phage FluMu gp28-like protein